ncbi:MAG TPA: DUF2148 domain-containing protein [Candidatus Didemnitutus sp.]|nr:DUF2148 domain-containing protein [Candidatus Didemnitutus sp.]
MPADQKEIFLDTVRHVAKLCATAAMTAPKSGGQLFLKGAKPFIETVIVEDRATLSRLADWLRARGNKLREPIWHRDADTAEKLDLVLFIGLAKWYPPLYDCGACGFPTCGEFTKNAAQQRAAAPGADDWEFAGPICQLRCIDLGIAVGSAAKAASLNNIDTRCQTRIASAARHLGVIEADLAVALSMSVSHKNIFFDKKMPEVKFDAPAPSRGLV